MIVNSYKFKSIIIQKRNPTSKPKLNFSVKIKTLT